MFLASDTIGELIKPGGVVVSVVPSQMVLDKVYSISLLHLASLLEDRDPESSLVYPSVQNGGSLKLLKPKYEKSVEAQQRGGEIAVQISKQWEKRSKQGETQGIGYMPHRGRGRLFLQDVLEENIIDDLQGHILVNINQTCGITNKNNIGLCLSCLVNCHNHNFEEKQEIEKKWEIELKKNSFIRREKDEIKYLYSSGFCNCGEEMKMNDFTKLWNCVCGSLEESESNDDNFIDISEGQRISEMKQRSGINNIEQNEQLEETAENDLNEEKKKQDQIEGVGKFMWGCPDQEVFPPYSIVNTEKAMQWSKEGKNVVFLGKMTHEFLYIKQQIRTE
ncbi:MAG: hypothetical protein EZS28_028126 [Streblomastix strix]|uniref:Uncharacterized protein n=1 Tax=Streblomastix strix TaxID=222440 RepID=A0A5J4V0X3_9EUKA|nr:MAG: hypothetical protein EZS28_028126 [Streblomastix strix]